MADAGNSSGKGRGHEARATIVCLLVLGAGMWFLARGLAHVRPAIPWIQAWPLSGTVAGWLALCAVLVGGGLVVAAAGLSVGRPWAWLVASTLAAAGFLLAALAWLYGAGPDWAGLALAFVALLALASPSVRLQYLGESHAER